MVAASQIDLISMLHRLTLPATSPFFPLTHQLNVKSSAKDPRAPILRREAEKHKRYDARLAAIGPGIKLLAFGMNHIGVLGDDAKKVIAEQATVLARQSSYSHDTAMRILRTHISISLQSV